MESSRPKTAAERMKKYREKKKQHDPEYRKRENERVKEYKRKKKDTLSKRQLEDLKVKKRQEKRLERQKKRNQEVEMSRYSSTSTNDSNEPEYHPYKCSQTYSKAVLKCLRSLPSCPIKKQCVIRGVAKRVGIELVKKMNENLNDSRNETVEQEIKDFYFRPDIVYTCPGMKDCMVVWENGEKNTLQKHYMTMFLKEAFAVFKEENPEIKIGFTKFCSLRPKNVLLMKNTPSEQCKCKVHENFIMKLKGLKISYSQKFWHDYLCDTSLKSRCWKNACDNCMNLKKMNISEDMAKAVIWKEWVKNSDNKIKLKLLETSAAELKDKILGSYQTFIDHVHIKRIQSEAFTTDKNDPNVRILQVDFSMSYSCEYQNEVQSALWARSSVTLFTAATFYKNKCQSYIICSNSQNKNKDSIFVFLNHLYDLIMTENCNENIQECLWSDGPSSEFKNKFMVRLLHYMSKKYNKSFSWKYFATAHGKGVIDGIGGNVKRLVCEAEDYVSKWMCYCPDSRRIRESGHSTGSEH